MNIFGSSGVRDITDRRFLQLVLDMGLAIGEEYRSVIVGYDTRTSGDLFIHKGSGSAGL